MSNPRAAAFAALGAAERAVHDIPQAITICTVGKIIVAMLAMLGAVRRVAEWMDAIETP